jgi:hypothetical protein
MRLGILYIYMVNAFNGQSNPRTFNIFSVLRRKLFHLLPMDVLLSSNRLVYAVFEDLGIELVVNGTGTLKLRRCQVRMVAILNIFAQNSFYRM